MIIVEGNSKDESMRYLCIFVSLFRFIFKRNKGNRWNHTNLDDLP